MGKLTVFGGATPFGTVRISGSKNEVLPVIFFDAFDARCVGN